MSIHKRPLNRSISIGSTLFIVALGLILSLVTYFSYRQAIMERYRAQMTDVLSYVDSHIDHEDLAQCVKTGEKSQTFLELQSFIDDIYVHHNLGYLYIQRVVDNGGTLQVFDVVTSLAPEDYDVGEGEIYTLGADITDLYPASSIQAFYRIQQTGELAFLVEPSDFGLDYTGTLPLKDSSGEVFALLCLDLPLNTIKTDLIRHTSIHFVLILLLGLLFILYFLRWMRINITQPIQQLEESVTAFALVSHTQRDPNLLNYEAPEIHTYNEVESLARAVAQMSADMKNYAISMDRAQDRMESMQSQVDRMGMLAFQDSLTKVKNKTAYQRHKNALNRTILMENAKFGIVMIDLNSLKKMNDTYGHKQGDSYIIGSSKLICSVFTHSPVYRIGGDEFVVILEGQDYDHRKALIDELTELFRVHAANEALPPWERYAAAIGFAVYTESDHTVDAVFKRADSRMYANKKAMKATRD